MQIIRITDLHTKPVFDTKAKQGLLEVTETFTFRYEYKGKIKYIYIPIGFRYNGASIPILRSDFSPRYLRASLVHDWLCKLWKQQGDKFEYSVEEMSAIFGCILELDGNPKWKCELFEFAVYWYKSLKGS